MDTIKSDVLELEQIDQPGLGLQLHEEPELEMTPEEFKKLKRRIDIAIVPFCTLLFALSAIDRINIGQAAVAHLLPDLHMTQTDYRIALSIFYVTYVLFEIPANVVLKAVSPHRFISVTMMLWAICTISMGLTHNAAGLQVSRVFLGVAEGGLFPGVSYMLSCWYTRKELSLRVSMFFAGSTIAGGFGGILAFGLRQMDGIGGKPGWAWIFIIEGLVTFVAGGAAWWLIRDFPETSNLLTEDEKDKWLYHLRKSSGMTTGQLPFSWHLVLKPFGEWQLYVYSVVFLAISSAQFSLALFTPTIVQGLGWVGSKANLMSAPPWGFAFVCLVILSRLSDRLHLRGPFIMSCMSVAAVVSTSLFLRRGLMALCYGVLLAEVSNGAKYAVLMLCTGATSTSIALVIAWVGGNYGPALSRASAMGLFFAVGTSGGIVSSNIYPSTNGPRFITGKSERDHGYSELRDTGNSVNLAMAVVAVLGSAILTVDNTRKNKSRDAVYGSPPVDGSDCSPLHADDPAIRAKYGLDMSKDDIIALGHHHPAFRLTA